MEYSLRYLGRSHVEQGPYRSTVTFSPNLSRERVWFDGELRDPLRFREAMSALHEVVVGDHRFQRRDKSAYEAWKKQKIQEQSQLRATLLDRARVQAAQEIAKQAIPANLEGDFRRLHRKYWDARVRWANELARNDPQMFRALVPCDPVISVADDVVFFEAFSKDESSYGCLYVDREGFVGGQDAGLGTTNVDYSMALYERFQALRTYRTTRLHLDPRGFDVAVEGKADYREEKIDLPPSWLRGFGQISATSGLATESVKLDTATIYSLLVFLRRNREKTGPRAIVFELRRGKPPALVLQPWGMRLESRGPNYEGTSDQDVKVWGRRRLSVLARLLPMIEHVEVQLLGNGLPSLWVAKMGEMRFLLALSGWTTNDWTRGTGLDLLSGAILSDEATRQNVWTFLRSARMADRATIAAELGKKGTEIAGALHHLGREGQLLYDPVTRAYRFRQVIDAPDARKVMTAEPEELTKGKELFLGARVAVGKTEPIPGNKRYLSAKIAGETCEAIVDADGLMTRAKCSCHHFFKNGLRAGPCRHLLALRLTAQGGDELRLQSASLGGGFIH
ncbi:MAG: SWIM zinc finger family protein [Deltaproteobacteria bacterium]|nr:SWIM zinc finger family protein [Deltaproteobacteria bacterium]